MAMTAGGIIGQARGVLLDQIGLDYPDAELLAWANEAAREVANLRPDLAVVIEEMDLVVGTLQTIPASGVRFWNLLRNSAGPGVQHLDKAEVERFNPGWAAAVASATVKGFFHDPRTPTVFEVFPPNTGAGRVLCAYTRVPAAMASLSDPWPLPDLYAGPAVDWVLFRAFSKDPRARAVGAGYLAAFDHRMGGKAQVDMAAEAAR
ncbi:hypothetical protein SAMN02949497_1931 [Methylomagnum ishizawai]|uniref:Uncharacterized protein n=1 Tax=Methylomagnum ishizawai TaxID=1760988 RepID=A0A1Y6CWJ4_9GAMM|nr:DUF6682 family protein [Methylomagnum ishizawai]SMF94610.1 hypothetical protein SAMN02949497_1931 [Methylomagnum ishizawai]